MQYAIYKPTPKISGAAFSFKLSHARDCVYLNAVSQSTWNDETKKGGFKENADNPLKSLSSKINVDELGGIVAALETFGEWSAFHQFKEDKTQFSLKKWDRSAMNKPDAMSFGITKNGSIKIGSYFEQKEIEVLKVFCREAIKEILWAKSEKQEKEAE